VVEVVRTEPFQPVRTDDPNSFALSQMPFPSLPAMTPASWATGCAGGPAPFPSPAFLPHAAHVVDPPLISSPQDAHFIVQNRFRWGGFPCRAIMPRLTSLPTGPTPAAEWFSLGIGPSTGRHFNEFLPSNPEDRRDHGRDPRREALQSPRGPARPAYALLMHHLPSIADPEGMSVRAQALRPSSSDGSL
jgi:hypothetical protein